MSQGGAAFPHGFPAQFQPVSVVDDAVHNRVREGRVSQTIMPICHRDLGREHGGGPAITIFKDFQKVRCLGFRQRIPQPVVDNQELGLGQDLKELGRGTLGSGVSDFLEEFRDLRKADRAAVAAGGLTQGAGQVGLARAHSAILNGSAGNGRKAGRSSSSSS